MIVAFVCYFNGSYSIVVIIFEHLLYVNLSKYTLCLYVVFTSVYCQKKKRKLLQVYNNII